MNVTPERWQQIARIYELAADQDPATRAAFLSEVCAGDEALRREVDSLLHQDAASVVLDRPVWATAAPLLVEGPNLPHGAVLGPYRIEGPLGAGGMGEVFRATDTRLNRLVAIKVLPARLALDQQMRARFGREARAVAALTHPHICTLYNVGRDDEVDFLVMEYLEGDTLAARLADGQLPLDLALAHAIEIVSALDHAHRHGIVHRDLKPANIMLTAGGAKLLDFGIAKFRPSGSVGQPEQDLTRAGTIPGTATPHAPRPFVGDEVHVTLDGSILGTVRYMAPEQIEGREADARSDLFSFGAVVYEMVTGRRAFDGDSVTGIRAAILEREPPPVSSLQPLASRALDGIVRRCLARNPDERWQTAGDVIRELKRVSESASQTPALAPPTGGAHAIIEGSVVRAGDKVRITANLIRGTTGDIIWAKSYERDLRDVLALQSEVARTITSEVGIALTPQEQARLQNAGPVDPEVHRQVLLGLHHAAKGTEDGLRKGIQFFDAAIAKDPANALGHAGLAGAYAGLSGFYVDPREVMPKATQAAETALRLDESLAYAHATLGMIRLVYDWDGPAAEKALLRALALNPSLSEARLNYAAYLTTQARHDEAVREIRHAVDLDPLSIRTHAFGTMFLLFSRRYDEAVELARRGLEFEPNSAFALAFQGVGYAALGRFREAVDNMKRAVQLNDSLTIRALQAHVLAVAGQKPEARKVIRQVEDAAKHRYFCPFEIGMAYVSLGDADTAYELFRKGTREHSDCMALLGVEPWLDPFRSDPRYAGLLRDIGIAPAPR